MNKPYVLYGRSGSGSLAVQVALEEIGTPYESIWVGREPDEVERLKKINPTGKVPALVLPGGALMFESAAILTYLAFEHPDAKLAPPPGTEHRAMFLVWMSFLSANLYEAVLRIYYSARYSSRGEADSGPVREQAMADFLNHAALIVPGLKPFVLGSVYSIADVYLYMLVSWYPNKEELLARLPALGAHSERILARPAVRKVEADHAAHA